MSDRCLVRATDGVFRQMARPVDPEKRVAILQAAKKIILRDGYASAKIAQIAAEAGVAAGTVYLYFESKEAIADALAAEFFQRAAALTDKHVPQIVEPQGIEKYIDAVVEFAISEKPILEQIRPDPGLADDEDSRQKRAQLQDHMGRLLTALMDEGKIQKYNANILGSLIFGIMHSIIVGAVIFEDQPLSEYRKTASDLLRKALKPE